MEGWREEILSEDMPRLIKGYLIEESFLMEEAGLSTQEALNRLQQRKTYYLRPQEGDLGMGRER